jgi:AraC-like DNA-binding protein
MAQIVGTGSFVSWDGACLLVGRAAGITPHHAHYALQIGFGSAPGIRFRPRENDEWTAYDGAMIPSRQPHAMDATVVPSNAVLFVEPETREGRAITARYLQGGIVPMPADVYETAVPALFDAWQRVGTASAIIAAGQRVVESLAGESWTVEVSDERILRAMAHIKAHLGDSLTLETVAAEAFLSPSRFRHLFVEQTGVSFRSYLLWRRFIRVWEILSAGGSLSTAAHEAGFADAAHLSRTSRQMFGFPPSALQVANRLRPEEDAR